LALPNVAFLSDFGTFGLHGNPKAWLGFACLMLGKSEHIFPNDGLMVIYHATE